MGFLDNLVSFMIGACAGVWLIMLLSPSTAPPKLDEPNVSRYDYKSDTRVGKVNVDGRKYYIWKTDGEIVKVEVQ